MMNEHDFNMQMQLNSSVNLGFLCVYVFARVFYFSRTWWNKNKPWNSLIRLFFFSLFVRLFFYCNQFVDHVFKAMYTFFLFLSYPNKVRKVLQWE